ncbi:type II secretion system major pseudopilin GspG [Allosphingosinicella vermicomposti]|uniref:type II secretion system major pseudopilin GspG n=1 Tax=Allosphingosinicella vermicomposti TaxID=614671 RepID=UPI000D0EF193|nr:type II secretion system major pseudopilin GspG [Allosphingosinicella vermicomposti]
MKRIVKPAAGCSDNERGFTLMEMLVVLVVIGIIAAVAIPQVMGLLESAKYKAARIQLETLNQSLAFYHLDTESYPTTEQGLAALWQAPPQMDLWNGPYVRQERQLLDPWGKPFVYRSPGKNRPFDLMTLGADGKEGGTGDDADLNAIK